MTRLAMGTIALAAGALSIACGAGGMRGPAFSDDWQDDDRYTK